MSSEEMKKMREDLKRQVKKVEDDIEVIEKQNEKKENDEKEYVKFFFLLMTRISVNESL